MFRGERFSRGGGDVILGGGGGGKILSAGGFVRGFVPGGGCSFGGVVDSLGR